MSHKPMHATYVAGFDAHGVWFGDRFYLRELRKDPGSARMACWAWLTARETGRGRVRVEAHEQDWWRAGECAGCGSTPERSNVGWRDVTP